MVLVFAGLSTFAGFLLAKVLGVNLQLFNLYIAEPSNYAYEINVLRAVQILSSIGTFIIPAMLFPKAIARVPVKFLMIKQPNKIYPFLLGILAIIICTPAISYVYEWNKSIHFPVTMVELEQKLRLWEQNAENIFDAFIFTNSINELIYNTLVIAIIPAIAEEFFFRGCLQNFIRMVFQNTHISILLAAIIFSGFHGQFFGFFPRVLLGVILGYIFVYSGNIWVSVATHFANNFLALLFEFLYQHYPQYTIFSKEYQFTWYAAVLSVVLTTLALYRLSSIRYKNLNINE